MSLPCYCHGKSRGEYVTQFATIELQLLKEENGKLKIVDGKYTIT